MVAKGDIISDFTSPYSGPEEALFTNPKQSYIGGNFRTRTQNNKREPIKNIHKKTGLVYTVM